MNKKLILGRLLRTIMPGIPTLRFPNKELMSILRKRESQNFDGTLTNHLKGLLNSEGSGNRDLIYHQIIARTITSLDEGQKKKYHRRLNSFVSSLDKIINNQ